MKNILLSFCVSSLLLLGNNNCIAQITDDFAEIDGELKLSKNTVLFYGNSKISCDLAYLWNGSFVILDKSKKLLYFLDNSNQIVHQQKIIISKKDFPVFNEYNGTLLLFSFADEKKSYIITKKNDIFDVAPKRTKNAIKTLNPAETSILSLQKETSIQVANLYSNKQRLSKIALLKSSIETDTLYKQNLAKNENSVVNIVESCPRISVTIADNIYIFDNENLTLSVSNFQGQKLAQLSWDKNQYSELKTKFIYFKIDEQTNKQYLVAYKNSKVHILLLEDKDLKVFNLEVTGKVLQIHSGLVYISAKTKEGVRNIYETKLQAK